MLVIPLWIIIFRPSLFLRDMATTMQSESTFNNKSETNRGRSGEDNTVSDCSQRPSRSSRNKNTSSPLKQPQQAGYIDVCIHTIPGRFSRWRCHWTKRHYHCFDNNHNRDRKCFHPSIEYLLISRGFPRMYNLYRTSNYVNELLKTFYQFSKQQIKKKLITRPMI